MNLQAVGQAPSDPNDELKLAIDANNQLRETLKKMRIAYDQRRMKELDTELKNAWMINTEVETRLKAAQEYGTAKPNSTAG